MGQFPEGFLWGTSSAAYQIEGAAAEGGRGCSIWDTFAHTPGTIAGGDTGDIADDHYHRYAEDVGIMRELGLGAYRFSVSWPRVQPGGAGALNPVGVAFYDRLLDELLEAGITPWITLGHWDLPQELEDAGGWPERETARRFVDYAVAVHERFADRVTRWTTFNEPWCTAFLGYYNGVHAPGRTDAAASLRAMHHVLVAHGWAVAEMRSNRPSQQYGITLNLYPVDAATDSAADRDAARRVDGVSNRLFTDPLLRGAYPEDILADLSGVWPADAVQDGDLEVIGTPLDLLGVNYYTRHVVRGGARPGEGLKGATDAFTNGWIGCDDVVRGGLGHAKTSMGWEIDPQGLYDVLTRLRDRYPSLPPLYITENGASFDDVVEPDGRVHDQRRVDFLRAHFEQAARAIADGVDLRGYLVWTLLDNFEWSFGFSRRFGLVHVDFATQERRVKDSGQFFGRVASGNGIPE